jgi:hypothetical protein
LAGALVFTIATGQLPRGATASHDQTNDTVDVLKLGEAMDMKALPRQEIPNEVYRYISKRRPSNVYSRVKTTRSKSIVIVLVC